MIRKTALLSGVAGVLMFAAPAFAQDPAPTSPPAETAPAQAEAAAPRSLTLQPGATVKGSDGLELGKLEGAQVNASGDQELTVRGGDGQLRAVPLTGIHQSGADVVVGWTMAEFTAAASLTSGTAATPATPATPAMAADPAAAAVPAEPADPATPAVPAEPATPAIPADPADPAEPAMPPSAEAPPADPATVDPGTEEEEAGEDEPQG